MLAVRLCGAWFARRSPASSSAFCSASSRVEPVSAGDVGAGGDVIGLAVPLFASDFYISPLILLGFHGLSLGG